MQNTGSSSREGRSEVHTEVRFPFEVVLVRIILFVFGVIEVFIAGRFLFLLTDANAEAGLVKFVYGISDFFMVPFVAIFQTQKVASGSVFEWSALVALLTYALVGWGISELVYAVAPRGNARTIERQVKSDSLKS